MTYHWDCNKSNTTGVTSGAEIHIVVRQDPSDKSLTITGDSLSYHHMNFCSTSDTRRVTLATTPEISH
jgi:hypothetical protein